MSTTITMAAPITAPKAAIGLYQETLARIASKSSNTPNQTAGFLSKFPRDIRARIGRFTKVNQREQSDG